MTQIKGLDKGVDPNDARGLQINQLNTIIKNYNSGKLNQRSPITKIERYRFIPTFPFIQSYVETKLNYETKRKTRRK